MWTSDNGLTFYVGDCRSGDRAATIPEIAALAINKSKRKKADDIATALAAEIAWGLAWQGKVYQIDQISQDRIGNRAHVARDCVAMLRTWLPLYEGWIAADNSQPEFTAQGFLDFAYAAHDLFTAIVLNANRLKAELLEASTIEQIEAIDVTTGWPTQE